MVALGRGMAGHWEELSVGLRAELPTGQGLSCGPSICFSDEPCGKSGGSELVQEDPVVNQADKCDRVRRVLGGWERACARKH